MIRKDDKIVYRDEVCTVVDILKQFKNNEDYYLLAPDHEPTLQIKVPIELANKNIRPVISKKEIEELIKKIPDIEAVPIDTWNRGSEYKELLSDGSLESVIRIIKTSYLRQQEKAERNQKASESDKQYYRRAEQLFYREISTSLDISFDEAKQYIVQKVSSVAYQ